MDHLHNSPKITPQKVQNTTQHEDRGNNQRQAPLTPSRRYCWSPKDFTYRQLRDMNVLPMPNEFTGFQVMSSSNIDLMIVETPKNKKESDFMDLINDEIREQIREKIIWEQPNSSSQRCSSESQQDQIPVSSHQQRPQNQEQQWKQLQESNRFKRKLSAEVDTPINNELNIKRLPCNCQKSKCLKLYCDCFRLRLTCQGCNCHDCHNTVKHTEQRQQIIDKISRSNPNAFNPKIDEQKHTKGCSCKKSNCLKKYCECYQAGLKCGINCKCQNCRNPKENTGNSKQKYRNTVKKIRQMVEI